MRVRIAAPVLTGALVLGALAAPTAAFAATAKPVITRAVSPSITLGLSGTITLGVTVSARDASGIKAIYAEPYPVALMQQVGEVPTAAQVESDRGDLLKAEAGTATTLTAGLSVTERVPSSAGVPSQLAGVWGVAVVVVAKNGATTFNPKATTFLWQRADTLASKVSATKVRKGAGLTVKGQLNRVNWAAHVFQGYGAQPVRLEFRRTGSATWTTVEKVTSGPTGALSATVRDYAGGSWRYVFDGNATSGSAASAQTWVGLS
jgi:hypothetical protein